MREPRILVTYHSGEGHTLELAEFVAEVLSEAGAQVDCLDAGTDPSPVGYDGVVIGDPVHFGHHSAAIESYLRAHADELRSLPTALFQVCLASVVDDDEHSATARRFLDDLLVDTAFDPDLVGLFAGALAYRRYGWIKRHMMRRIAEHDGLSTDASRNWDYTDYEAVRQFALDLFDLVTSRGIIEA